MMNNLPVKWSAQMSSGNEYVLHFVGAVHAHVAVKYANERDLKCRYIYNANGCYGMYSRTDAEVTLDPILYQQASEHQKLHQEKQYSKKLVKYRQDHKRYLLEYNKWQQKYNEWLIDGPRQIVQVGCIAPEIIHDEDYSKLFPDWGKNRKDEWRFFVSSVPAKGGKVRIMCDRPKEFPVGEPLKPSEPRIK